MAIITATDTTTTVVLDAWAVEEILRQVPQRRRAVMGTRQMFEVRDKQTGDLLDGWLVIHYTNPSLFTIDGPDRKITKARSLEEAIRFISDNR